LKWSLSVAFVALAVLANWLASKYTVHVPFTPYLAPAGVFCIGAALVLRDWIQQIAGLWWTLALVIIGGVASYLIGDAAGWTGLQKIAVASLVAFIVSETVEAAVFTPIRNRSLTVGVLASGMVGNALDSWLFLTLAFGSTAFFWGNFWGKAEMILVGGLLTALRRHKLPVAA
jgi:queuosine precursor transporter